jgi:hypothetical protein
VSAVQQAAQELVRERLILAGDAADIVQQAEESAIGR